MAFSPETYAILKGKIKQLEEEIAALTGPTDWIGVTTTPITDGSEISTVVINNKNVEVHSGDTITYDNSMYIYNGEIWQEFPVAEDYLLKDGLLQQTGQTTDNTMSQKAITDALNTKQNALTFDNAPTQNSDNPVKSRGIYQAIQDAISSGTVDDEVTENSSNPVKSSGIYSAIHEIDTKLSLVYTWALQVQCGLMDEWNTIEYADTSYYYVMCEGVCIGEENFPHFTQSISKLLLRIEYSPVNVVEYNAYYIYSEDLEGYCICAGEGSEESVIASPDFIFAFFDGNIAYLYSKQSSIEDFDLARYSLLEIFESNQIQVDNKPTKDSYNLVHSHGIHSVVKPIDDWRLVKTEKSELKYCYNSLTEELYNVAPYIVLNDGNPNEAIKNFSIKGDISQDLGQYDHVWEPGSGKNLIDEEGIRGRIYIGGGRTYNIPIPTITEAGKYSFSAKIEENSNSYGTFSLINSDSMEEIDSVEFESGFNGKIALEGNYLEIDDQITCVIYNQSSSSFAATSFMFEKGDEASDYEPYYFKAPIEETGENTYLGLDIRCDNGIRYDAQAFSDFDDWEYDDAQESYYGPISVFNQNFRNFNDVLYSIRDKTEYSLFFESCVYNDGSDCIFKITYIDDSFDDINISHVTGSYGELDGVYTKYQYIFDKNKKIKSLSIETSGVNSVVEFKYFCIVYTGSKFWSLVNSSSLDEVLKNKVLIENQFEIDIEDDDIEHLAAFNVEIGNDGKGTLKVTAKSVNITDLEFNKVVNENIFYTDDLKNDIVCPEGEYGANIRCSIYNPDSDLTHDGTIYVAGKDNINCGRVYIHPHKLYDSVESFYSDISLWGEYLYPSKEIQIAYYISYDVEHDVSMYYYIPSTFNEELTNIKLLDGYNVISINGSYPIIPMYDLLFNLDVEILYIPKLKNYLDLRFNLLKEGTFLVVNVDEETGILDKTWSEISKYSFAILRMPFTYEDLSNSVIVQGIHFYELTGITIQHEEQIGEGYIYGVKFYNAEGSENDPNLPPLYISFTADDPDGHLIRVI